MAALAMASQNSTTTRAAFGAPAQLAALVAPGVGALDRPAAAGLDRRGLAPPGDLASHAARGKHLPAGLEVVASVQVHHRPGGQRHDLRDGVHGGQGGGQQPVVAAIGRGRDAPSTASRRCSATPALIHSSRRRRSVVAEQLWSAILR